MEINDRTGKTSEIRLPLSLSSFVGRADELGQLEPLVLTQRLVTLTGPGGAGKTRLAYEVAARLSGEFADGVRVVELAAISDPVRVPHVVAVAVGLLERDEQGLVERLAEYLEGRNLLLVLDNCEHLVEACAGLATELLSRCCVDLRILATSREPLGVPGEVAWRVPPLAQPPASAKTQNIAHLDAWDATRLFLERARTALPVFAPTEADAAAIATICARLDGMPLAIELAAARVTVLTPEQIAGLLEQGLGLLSNTARTAPARHRTLAAAIEWSYRLLDAHEAAVLDRLSVFRGGWPLEAAEAVCADVIERAAVVGILAQLVAKSLVVAEPHDGAMRYRLLETIRHYAAQRLAEKDEVEVTGERHVEYYLALAERAQPELRAVDQLAWADCLDLEQDNFRAALSFALDGAPASLRFTELALRLVIAVDALWDLRGKHSETHAWLERVLALAGSKDLKALRGRALLLMARCSWLLGGSGAEAYASESRSIFEELGPGYERGLADALNRLGEIRWSMGRLTAARVEFERSLALRDRHTESLAVADSLVNLGMTWADEKPALARKLLEQGVAMYVECRDSLSTTRPRYRLGLQAMREGDYGTARTMLEQCLTEARRRKSTHYVMRALVALSRLSRCEHRLADAAAYAEAMASIMQEHGWHHEEDLLELGYVAFEQGDLPRARQLFEASLDECRRIEENQPGIPTCLVALARLQFADEHVESAAQLLGAAEKLLGGSVSRQYLGQDRSWDECEQLVHSRLGQRDFAVHLNRGRALSLEGAIALALSQEEGEGSPQRALTPRQAAKAQYGGLTAREREMAGWVAKGLTNREIAAALFVTERTIEAHVSNILSKLEFTSRAQIAVWAVNKGLATAPADRHFR